MITFKKGMLPRDSDFYVTFDIDEEIVFSNMKWPQYPYLFNPYLWITEQHEVDEVCKKIDERTFIINILVKRITELEYTEKQLVELQAGTKNIYTITTIQDIVQHLFNNTKEKSDLNTLICFQSTTLKLTILYFLLHLYNKVVVQYSTINHHYLVTCEQFIGFDIFTEVKLNDLLTYKNAGVNFTIPIKSVIKDQLERYINSIVSKFNHYNEDVLQLRREQLLNQKRFSISVSKFLKQSLIESVNFAKQHSLPLSELYQHFDPTNCMIYRLNRFFPYISRVDHRFLL